jgi:hypothetical protein
MTNDQKTKSVQISVYNIVKKIQIKRKRESARVCVICVEENNKDTGLSFPVDCVRRL